MKDIDLSISIVVYKNKSDVIAKLLDGILEAKLKTQIFIIDNSPDDSLRWACDKKAKYIFNNKNVGYGAGHNMAINYAKKVSKYHLIVNPDIYFFSGTLEKLYDFMEQNCGVGLVMPKVMYPDGSLQYLCRLLPVPLDLFARRLDLPLLRLLNVRRNSIYELKFADYNKQMDVPYLSGCFMFIRTDVFESVGFFDERYFMYLEDVDLSRRIHYSYRTVYYPGCSVYHGYQKASYKDSNLFKHHIFSAIKYFNKWGWFYDEERKRVNTETLKELKNGAVL